MIPVIQTRLAPPRDELGVMSAAPGNCWSACVAPILELPISDVPDEAKYWQPGMTHRESWRPFAEEMYQFLAGRGLAVIDLPRSTLICFMSGPKIFDQIFNIMSGQSPRDPNIYHAVVARGYEIAHDPHPSRDGLAGDAEKWTHELFIKI